MHTDMPTINLVLLSLLLVGYRVYSKICFFRSFHVHTLVDRLFRPEAIVKFLSGQGMSFGCVPPRYVRELTALNNLWVTQDMIFPHLPGEGL